MTKAMKMVAASKLRKAKQAVETSRPYAEKIDELIQALEQDNGYAANEPDERSFILSALQAGAQALRDQTVIYRMQFRAFIWEPVKQVATRFGPSAIGVIADTAKEIIKDWLKSAAKNWWS